jgi:RNA polymerase sigma-70 factor (ECF subfamily)
MRSAWSPLTIALVVVGRLSAQEITVETAPPVVIRTVPEAGATEVQPTLAAIRVTFSKEMRDRSWSFVSVSDRSFPKVSGDIHFGEDGRTCVLPVQLEPGRTYVLWINSERFRNFQDRDGRVAVPYLLVFRTSGTASEPPKDLGHAFDALWEDMARHYSYFELKGVDWKGLRNQFRPRAMEARSTDELIDVLRAMLAPLEDGHVWIDHGGRRLPTSPVPRPADNFHRPTVFQDLVERRECGRFAVVGRTVPDGFGVILLIDQPSADENSVGQVIDFIRAWKDAPGFLVDLRSAAGGDERLAQRIAGQFCAEEVVYALGRFRDGPEPGDLGPPRDRRLPAVEDPYTRPVVCLIGPGCVSSGEGFAKMMKALPHVTLVGAATRGSSGNPQPFPLPGLDVSVWYSRWVDLLPDGTPIEGRGLNPDVRVDAAPDAYSQADPTWEKAREVLRNRVRESRR